MGGGRAKWVMVIKDGTCDEHWMLSVSDESLNSAPETIFTNVKWHLKKKKVEKINKNKPM